MAKPVDNDKNPNNKKPFEISTTNMILISNIILIIVIVVSMMTIYSLLNHTIDRKITLIQGEESYEETGDEDSLKEGILLDLGDFILNLADTTHRRYLKVGIALELSKTEEELQTESISASKSSGHGESISPDKISAISTEMERYKPAIRDAVISVLSNKTSDELSTPTGKELAKEEILEMVNGIFAGQREVMRVSFGQFIIQ